MTDLLETGYAFKFAQHGAFSSGTPALSRVGLVAWAERRYAWTLVTRRDERI